MGLLPWLRGLWARLHPATVRRRVWSPPAAIPRRPGRWDARAGAPPVSHQGGHSPHHPQPALPRRDAYEEPPRADSTRPAPAGSEVLNLDRVESLTVLLEGEDDEILWRLSERIEKGRFEIPQLPSTSLAAIEMCNRASADVKEIAELITTDPLLSGDLLRVANSVLYAAQEPAVTLHEAVMRVGLRALRSLILSASMRSVLLSSRGLAHYAEEVWRQSVSVAMIAREIADALGFEREKAYALGLLHDVGKVALLAMLGKELKSAGDLTPARDGQAFRKLHERAGAAMARAWRLPEEICSVAGSHHQLGANLEHPRAAALANLAHSLDLHLSLGDEQGYRELVHSQAFDLLAAQEPVRHRVLASGREAYSKAQALVAEARIHQRALRPERASSRRH